MFESINLDNINLETLPKFKDTNLFVYNNELLKLTPQNKQKNIMKMHQFFLLNPIPFCISPNKVLFKDDKYVGYSMNYDLNYKPLSSYKDKLTKEQKIEIIKQVYEYLMITNNYFIYSDIDEDNILYNNKDLKLIDFDDVYLKKDLTKEKEESLLLSQRMVFNLFACSLIYNVSINDIYYLKNSDKLSDNEKEEIRNLLDSDEYLINFDKPKKEL